MKDIDLAKWAKEAAEWSAKYRSEIGSMPVRSQARQGDTLAALPESPPEDAEEFGKIMDDFRQLVPPGLTHWQHPRFFAYFPANSLPASVVAEQLTAAIGANCMLWQTSPVGTEMEIRTMEWLSKMCGLPTNWRGVIQDTASSANFAAAVTARERALDWQGLEKGLSEGARLRFYMSPNSHSSATKALMLAGIGKDNAVMIPTLPSGSMDPEALHQAIDRDRKEDMVPAGVMAVVGATGTGVSDDLEAVGKVVEQEGLYGHVDAAWAGSAMVCPEHRHLIKGLERWDSYVFNPHKWLGANFDLSAHFLKDPDMQVRAMSATPDYLRTTHAQDTVDFCNWTPPLGRRFRALKLWFVIRAYGVSGLRGMIRNHIAWAQKAAETLRQEKDFEMVGAPQLAMFLFRHRPDLPTANEHNERLLTAINDDGFCYLTQTMVDGNYCIRFQVGSTTTTEKDVHDSLGRICDIARKLA